ncbi:tubulin polyglutamylase TTLL11-like isoform X2 [Mya arenaria]|uniref:tubulin polyglutamylase TTLL11-like isoform X2 n=1 Tax=Mya arenaria TaxID=6604 RepID=UPI0022E4135E|nr:tubulin polyglutamylase TTLL11-like isoform X2 [Mya arenaria]
MSASRVKKTPDMRVADLRRELTFREKKVAEIKREKIRSLADTKPVPKLMITVDLSHARGNLDALKMCLKELEWKEFPFGRKDQHCDIHWQCQSFEQNPDLYGGKVNKFPGMCWICSKQNLFRVLDQMALLYPEEYNFHPRTWYLPEQLHALANEMKKMNEKRSRSKATFIVKPDSGSQGEGIYLIRDVQDYLSMNSGYQNVGKLHVCQEYLADVFLIDKFKFDLRVYAVLKSADPLELYVCKEGLARFATVPYEYPTNKNIHEVFMHLTNYSLNKKSATFNRSEKEDEGSKRTLTSVFTRLRRHGYNIDKLWKRIEQIIVKTMIAIIPDLKIEFQNALPANKPGPTCFQILGFDILLMHDLKPMLLEINSSPSLRIDSEVEVAPGVPEFVPSPKDEEAKIPLIRDTLLLVAPDKKVKYLERRKIVRQKRRRKRREKRRKKHEEDQRHQAQEESQKPPTQIERDGIIHVETSHPRSSIVIIRSSEDDEPRKPRHESSFVLPNIYTDGMSAKKHPDENENDITDPCVEHFNQEYVERHEFVDCVEKMQNDSDEENDSCGVGKITSKPEDNKKLIVSRNQNGNNLIDVQSVTRIQSSSRIYNNSSSSYYSNLDYENKMEESSGSEDEGHVTDDLDGYCSSLKQVYPDTYADKYDKFRIYEKLAIVFTVCLGVRATQRLGPTGFRTFARKCRLNKKGLTNATIDILFIDMQRKWEHVNPERTTGLGFRGFLDACHEIARRKFLHGDILQTMEEFIDYCLENLQEDQLFQARNNPRLLTRRTARPHGYPILEPMVEPLRTHAIVDEQTGIFLDSRLHPGRYLKPSSTDDVDFFLRKHGRLQSIKTKRSKSRTKNLDER